MTEVRDLLHAATEPPATADPVAAVRAVARRRRRTRRAVAAGAAAMAVTGAAALAARPPARTGDGRPVSTPSPAREALPSGGSVPATRPTGGAVDVQNAGVVALGEIVTEHREAFVGMYVDDRGVAVVAFGPTASAAAWERRLGAAAGPQAWRTTRCPYEHAELAAVQGGLETFDWPSGRPALGAHVDARTCSVLVVTGPLPAADVAALRDAFGARVTLDQTGDPRRD